jgi:hypothetical protein
MARTAAWPASQDAAAQEPERRAFWCDAFRAVRAETERRASYLSAEDQIVQSMADASPTKWHRAHVTWFFEQFLLVPHLPDYKIFDERFPFLFNSYYVAAGPRHARPQRGLITRPNADDVAAYRAHVDAAIERLIETTADNDADRVFSIVEIGLNHEQQHQELLLTDILHAFAQNPTNPAYDPDLGRAAMFRCRRACMRSGMRARASASTTKHRGTRCSFRSCASRVISSPTPNGSNSSRPAGIVRPRCGCRTAGRPCRRKVGRRPAIGARSTAPGMR